MLCRNYHYYLCVCVYLVLEVSGVSNIRRMTKYRNENNIN